MKRFLALLIVLLFVPFAYAGQIVPIWEDISGVSCDDCSGTLKFAWHMEDNDSTPDVTLGNPCGCSDGDTIGAETGSPAFSSAQNSDGTLALHINALDEDYAFASTTYDIIDVRDVKITFDLYIVSFPSAGNFHSIIEINDSDYNYIQLKDDGIRTYGSFGGTAEALSIVLSTGVAYSCEYQADQSKAGSDHYIICGAVSDEDDDDFAGWNGDGTGTLKFGDTQGNNAGEYHLDNVKIYPADRW